MKLRIRVRNGSTYKYEGSAYIGLDAKTGEAIVNFEAESEDGSEIRIMAKLSRNETANVAGIAVNGYRTQK